MPQDSAYYTDLQIPTVNSDGSTYGTIINEFLNGLLMKLKNLSDRVEAAKGQLTDINRGANSISRINNTFAGVIGSSALVSGSWTILYPDPYSGSYTKTTAWPAYASDLTAFSPPTTQSEIENFNYEGFAEVLQEKLDLIEATVDQAEADVLASQINCCRTKKVLDAISASSTTTSNQYQQLSYSGYTVGTITSSNTMEINNASSSFPSTNQDVYGYSFGPSTIPRYEFSRNSLSPLGSFRVVPSGQSSIYNLRVNYSGVLGRLFDPFLFKYSDGRKLQLRYSGGKYILTLPSGMSFCTDSDNSYPTLSSGTVQGGFYLYVYTTVTTTTKPSVDLSPCNNPTPPYFS